MQIKPSLARGVRGIALRPMKPMSAEDLKNAWFIGTRMIHPGKEQDEDSGDAEDQVAH
jgi:hypothetical protein